LQSTTNENPQKFMYDKENSQKVGIASF